MHKRLPPLHLGYLENKDHMHMFLCLQRIQFDQVLENEIYVITSKAHLHYSKHIFRPTLSVSPFKHVMLRKALVINLPELMVVFDLTCFASDNNGKICAHLLWRLSKSEREACFVRNFVKLLSNRD